MPDMGAKYPAKPLYSIYCMKQESDLMARVVMVIGCNKEQ
jgi:hypothetical protein